MDERIDRAIEAEKLSALQRYRLHPITLRPTAPEESAVRSRAWWMPLGRQRLAGAGAALLVLGLLVVLRYERHSSTPGISRQSIEWVLSAANTAQQGPVSAGISASSVREAASDTAWTIQRVLYRMQLLQYSAHHQGAAVLQALSNVHAQPRPAAAWVEGPPPGFEQRMEQLVSSNAVERVLSGLQR
jgi:hypothetical protein